MAGNIPTRVRRIRMKKKVIIPIAIIVGVAAVALGVILGLKACSKDTENETEATVIITNENGETFISTADSTVPASSGDIVTDGTDKTDAERNGNTLGSDTSDTSGTNASGTTTTTSGSGNGSGYGTSESTGGTNGTTKHNSLLQRFYCIKNFFSSTWGVICELLRQALPKDNY